MPRSSIASPGRTGWAAGWFVAMLPALAVAAPLVETAPASPPPAEAPPSEPPPDEPPLVEPPPPSIPPAEAPPEPPPATALPVDPAPPDGAPPADASRPVDESTTDGAPPPVAKRRKAGSGAGAEPSKPNKKKPKKKKPAKAPHRVNQGTAYRLGLFPSSYVQGPGFGLGAAASVRQTLDPKPKHRLVFGLDYRYEPFSTKTLGFPEEDEAGGDLLRTLTEPVHSLAFVASRRFEWSKLVTTSIDLQADGWWPGRVHHRRYALWITPGIRVGRTRGLFGELTGESYLKLFPQYFIAGRHIDQIGARPTARLGYNFGKVVRLAAGFTFDYTHYLNSRYNQNIVAADGSYARADDSKNYLDYIPFAELQVRPVKGLRLQGRYAFERQRTRNYDRVMTGRDEFDSLVPKFFYGYYDYRRHRASLAFIWTHRDRLRMAGMVEGWVRHFDVYEARTVDNYWTGQLRFDAEIEASLEAAVRVHTIRGKHLAHDLFVSLLGAHVTRTSNMRHEISLATNFDITRVMLGFEIRGH